MSRVYLVRHAATSWSGARFCGRTDLPLSAEGRAQAVRLARAFADRAMRGARIVASPLRRATETAAAIAVALDAGVNVDERLREADFGLAEGRPFGEIAREHPALANALRNGAVAVDWPQGDSAASFARRIAALSQGLEDWAAVGAVLVGHGGPYRALLATLGLGVATLEPADVVVLERAGCWRLAERWSTR